jgi:gluconokinase
LHRLNIRSEQRIMTAETRPTEWKTHVVLVCGVSGCGKSTIGREIARRWSARFADADDFHSAENKEKMRNRTPLTDADREGWLRSMESLIGETLASQGRLVLAVSGLKRLYRDRLREANPAAIRVVWMTLTYETAYDRVKDRVDHFFPKELVSSQFQTAEPPTPEERPVYVDATLPIDRIGTIVDLSLGLTE